ncbi:hypothetical protein SDC9_93120 [bioreactor metagenome]|uniref:Uncharacterized protein n=1 Tax=bioreactor metagenome TaxID=1076179 RepID=A0A644ZZM0_9ZZZZ
MNIKFKGHTCTTKFINTLLRIKSSSHANLEYMVTKGSQVADDIYIPCLTILQLDDLILLFFDLPKVNIQLFQLRDDFNPFG